MSFIPGIDLKNVEWKPTAQVHLFRSLAAGIVWGLIMLFTTAGSPDAPPWWAMPVMVPLVYFVALPIYLAIARVASLFGDIGKAIGGFITLILAAGIVVGDPLTYVLHRNRPDLVPVERFKFFNFVCVIFVQSAAPARVIGHRTMST